MMTQKPVRTFFTAFTLLASLSVIALGGGTSTARASALYKAIPAVMQADSGPSLITRVAGDCAAIGQKVAASQGGTLTKATPAVQNGAPVCVVVVLVPGRAGERPRRVEVAVPAK